MAHAIEIATLALAAGVWKAMTYERNMRSFSPFIGREFAVAIENT